MTLFRRLLLLYKVYIGIWICTRTSCDIIVFNRRDLKTLSMADENIKITYALHDTVRSIGICYGHPARDTRRGQRNVGTLVILEISLYIFVRGLGRVEFIMRHNL